jgi:hypothetical protein
MSFIVTEKRVTRIYLETTIGSYLVSRPSRDLAIAARQELTHEWWEERRSRYDVFVSQSVLDEAAGGDPEVARRRLASLSGVPLLAVTDEVTTLAEAILRSGLIPDKAAIDAFQPAIASVHEMDVPLTRNCSRLANAELLGAIGRLVRAQGYELPVTCTPDELMGDLA